MKKILLLSDTHGFIDEQILKYVKMADEVWHAGDFGAIAVADEIRKYKPLRAVYGNIDNSVIRSEFPLDNRFICEDLEVWITHIGGYPNNYDARIRQDIKEKSPMLFISGHSHILKVMFDKKLNLLHMNPGAAGKSGFHSVRTMLRFSVSGKEIKDLEIIELETRK
ncbi:MAG: metallophosphatase family protein [Flavobacteriaceae bacterium]|nr:metallophosphatase family protein [Flavobacteriaceae bacterium]